MKKLLIILFLFYSILTFSQDNRNCGTSNRNNYLNKLSPKNIIKQNSLEEKIQEWIKHNENTKTSAITIPVVVHIIYKNNTENISDAQIHSQIDVLNEDFRRLNQDANNTPLDFMPYAADMQIEFCLAKRHLGIPSNGIVRKSTALANFPLYSDSVFFTN